MLTLFTIRNTFEKARITLTVDCERKEADVTITYDRRIVRMETLKPYQWDDVRTPELAQKWLGREVSAGDGTLSFTEWVNWFYRRHPDQARSDADIHTSRQIAKDYSAENLAAAGL